MFGFYLALGLVSIGWYPLSNPTRVCACSVNTDPTIFMWSLQWWPYALLHGLDPLWSHYVWAPTGANLVRATTIPAAALALAPATALFGVVASYNLMLLASPVLAAFTAYLLCRRIVGRELPAIVGGYLFGFGAFEFAQLVAHPNISLIFLIPVMVHLAVRRLARELSAIRYIAAMALVIVAQMGLSTELLLTSAAIGGVVLLAAFVLSDRPERLRVDRLLLETIAAGWCALVVTAPFLYYAVLKGGSPHEWPLSETYGIDLLNPFIPTQVTWLGSSPLHAIGNTFEIANPAEAGAYLSLPVIAAFVIWALRTRRRLLMRLLLVGLAVSFVAGLGSYVHVDGSQVAPAPFDLVKNFPVLRLLTPSRMAVYVALAVAIGAAAWLGEAGRGRRPGLRWLVVGLGAIMIAPNIGGGLYGSSPSNPAFFRTSAVHRYLTPNETALVMPFGWNDNSMMWQAEADFSFRMPEGYLGHFAPAQFEAEPALGELYSNKEVNPTNLERFIAVHDISDILVDESEASLLSGFTAELSAHGLSYVRVGGVGVYRIPSSGFPVQAIAPARPAPHSSGA